MKRVHVFIEGYVQGVFFRHNTQLNALKHNVRGWIRNLPDGRVEAVFEGDYTAIDKMIEFCRKGPPAATVKNVEVKQEEWKGEFKDFRILL